MHIVVHLKKRPDWTGYYSSGLHFVCIPKPQPEKNPVNTTKIKDFFTCKGKPRMGLPVISQDQVIYCTQTRVWTGVCVCAHNKS